MALFEYQEADARILLVPQADSPMNTWDLSSRSTTSSSIHCFKPFTLRVMATFDPRDFPCHVINAPRRFRKKLFPMPGNFPNHYTFRANYTPIADYSIWFRPVSLLTDLEASAAKNQIFDSLPRFRMRLARPELKRTFASNSTCQRPPQDLVESDWR